MRQLAALFEQKETEENWTKLDDGLSKLAAITRGSAHLPSFVGAVKIHFKMPIVNCLMSERTRLARTAIILVEELARHLRERFESLSDFLLPAVLRLTMRANKVYVTSSSAALKTCIECSGVPSFALALGDALKNPSKTMRIAAMDAMKCLMVSNGPERLVPYIEVIEASIRDGVVDSLNEVRSLTRAAFEVYGEKFPELVNKFQNSLPDIAKKYLKIDASKQLKLAKKHRPFVKTGSNESLQDSASVVATQQTPFVEPSIAPARVLSQSATSTPAATFGPRRVLGVPVRVHIASNATTDQNQDLILAKTLQNRITHLFEHVGGAQRVAIPEKQHFGVSLSAMTTPLPTPDVSERKSKLKPASRVPAQTPSVLKEVSKLSTVANTLDNQALENNDAVATQPRIMQPFNASRKAAFASRRQENVTESENSSSRLEESATSSTKSDEKKHTELNDSVLRHNTNSELIDVPDLRKKLKSTDWAVRESALDTLLNIIKANYQMPSAERDGRSKATFKIAELIAVSLSDVHFRVVHKGLTACFELISRTELIPSILEVILPKVFGVHFGTHQRSNQRLLASTKPIVDLVLTKYPGIILLGITIQTLNTPEYSSNLKLRVGCIGFLSELPPSVWREFLCKPSNCKLVLIRLAPMATETDPFLQKCLRYILKLMAQELEATPGNIFWNAFATLKTNDKKMFNTLFGKDIEYDQQVLFSENSRVDGHSKPSSTTGFGRSGSRLSSMRPARSLSSSPTKSVISEQSVSPRRRQSDVSVSLDSEPQKLFSNNKHELYEDGLVFDDLVAPSVECLLQKTPKPGQSSATALKDKSITSSRISRVSLDKGKSDEATPTAKLAWLQQDSGANADDDEGDAGSIPSATPFKIEQTSDYTQRTPKQSVSMLSDLIHADTHRETESTPVVRRVQQQLDTAKSTPSRIARRTSLKRFPANSSSAQAKLPSTLTNTMPAVKVQEPQEAIEREDLRPKDQEDAENASVTPVAASPSNTMVAGRLTPDDIELEQQSNAVDYSNQKLVTKLDSMPLHDSLLQLTRSEEEMLHDDHIIFDALATDTSIAIMNGTHLYTGKDSISSNGFNYKQSDKQNDDGMDAFRQLLNSQANLRLHGGLETFLRASHKHLSLWETHAPRLCKLLLNQLCAPHSTGQIIKNSLFMLCELVVHQNNYLVGLASEILVSVLQCETDMRCTTEEVLEIAYELERILEAFQLHFPPSRVISSVIRAFDRGLGQRICYEMVHRIVEGGFSHLISGGSPTRLKAAGAEEDKTMNEELLVEYLARGLDSSKAATRKAAFDCAYAILRLRGSEWGDRLFNAVRDMAGMPRESVVRGMMERRMQLSASA